MKIKLNKKVSYLNFGYIPTGNLFTDLSGKLFGTPNLVKRLQARDIMNTLDLKSHNTVLDFGCGVGYVTVEMAKIAEKAFGIDTNEYIGTIPIPIELSDRLQYIIASGENLPFEDSIFDVILASEVLPMISEPLHFLKEISRVLKPGGRLIIVNGSGHPSIKEAYKSKPWYFKLLNRLYNYRMPESYEKYCQILQKSFDTAQKSFFQEEDISLLLNQVGFLVESFDYSPGYVAGSYFSWSQFILYLRTGKTLSQHSFVLKYYLLSFIRLFERKKHKGGIICKATKQ